MASESSLRTDCGEYYRLALLLTGDPAHAGLALEAVATEGGSQFAQIRDEKRRAAWFVRRLRERCSGPFPISEGDPAERIPREAREVVLRIHRMEEPDRSAVALFYLNRFTGREIAHLLDMRIEELAQSLQRGRQALAGAVEEDDAEEEEAP